MQLILRETTDAELKVLIPIKRNNFENHIISREILPKHQGLIKRLHEAGKDIKLMKRDRKRNINCKGKKKENNEACDAFVK